MKLLSKKTKKKLQKLNRKILTQFLKDLEMYIGSISEIAGGVIDMKYLSKNGVDEKAVQCNFESYL